MRLRVYRNEYNGRYNYTTLAKNKTQDGKELKVYVPVGFKHGTEPQVDSIDITPTEWFMSCYEAKNGEIKPRIIVTSWKDYQSDNSNNDFTNSTLDELANDNLPFY